jgi:hypothetical protein
MMIVSSSNTQQDTVKIKISIDESIRIKTFSLPEPRKLFPKDTLRYSPPPAAKPAWYGLTDTTSVCERNIIADITFNDTPNFITTLKPGFGNRFPFIFIEKNRLKQDEAKAVLFTHLKNGEKIPPQPLHDDWIILVILASAFLYSLIRSTTKRMFPGIMRFLLLRGINDPSSRAIGGLFSWHSTILNFASFLIISLFIYCTALFFDLAPSGTAGMTGYLTVLGIIITAVTLRHFTCLLTGNLSGQREVFRVYLVGVYQSYRLSALFLLIIIILLSYTFVLPSKMYIIIGITGLSLMYFIRILSLLKIFINRNISIFYLILYLCALEILPVGISVKYFTGLF